MKKQLVSKTIPQDMIPPSKFKKEEVTVNPPPESTCEKVKEFRGNLIANVAHDLRTPLQSIIGYSETMLLRQAAISEEEQAKYLDIILTNATKLSSMIEEFFEYSKLEISEIVPEKTSFLPNKIAEDLIKNYELISSERNICIGIHLEENLPPIDGDYLMIYRVFQNMVDNAIKFTPSNGEIKIHLTKHSDMKLKVQISDTGSGIPHDELDSIFNKFQRAKEIASGTEQNNGLGLGLTIVKQILSLHDTKISVNSELGVGTAFTFFLPFA